MEKIQALPSEEGSRVLLQPLIESWNFKTKAKLIVFPFHLCVSDSLNLQLSV